MTLFKNAFSNRTRSPRIGVTGPDRGGWPAWMATRIAIWRAGGRAVRITPSNPHSLDGLSGLIIGGGADVNPKLYNEDCVRLEARKQLRRAMYRRWRRKQTYMLLGYCPLNGFCPSPWQQLTAFARLTRYRLGLMADFVLLVLLWLVRHLMSVPWESVKSEHTSRDTLEVPLIREAISRGLPVLGICRGMQLLNVCLGGSLYQEISVFYEETPVMTTLLPKKRVEISADSTLAGIFRRTSVFVNSLHFQSVRSLGEGLRVVAREPNGIVQAIEHTGPAFIVGVQWHPEYLAFEKPSQQRLFKKFVEAARSAETRPHETAAAAASLPSSDRDVITEVARSQAPSLVSKSSYVPAPAGHT